MEDAERPQMATEMGSTPEIDMVAYEQHIFDLKLPEIMVGDPRHADRYKCKGCDRIMDLHRVNDRVAFYSHRCEQLDDRYVLLVVTSFAKDLYKKMIKGLLQSEGHGNGTEDKPTHA